LFLPKECFAGSNIISPLNITPTSSPQIETSPKLKNKENPSKTKKSIKKRRIETNYKTLKIFFNFESVTKKLEFVDDEKKIKPIEPLKIEYNEEEILNIINFLKNDSVLNKNLQTIINDIINELNENKDLNEVGFGLKYLKSKTLFFFIYNNQQNI
jgi:hypothetical protein